MAFIDSKKAIYLVETAAVTDALREQGVGEMYIGLLEDIHGKCTGTYHLS